MTLSRRTFLASTAAAGTITLLPFTAHAAGHAGNTFETPKGEIAVHPVAHASVVLETPAGVIYVDPVGDVADYAAFPRPDLVLITHEHGDHMNAETLAGLTDPSTPIVTNQGAFNKMTAGQQNSATVIGNFGSTTFDDVTINAVAAYNTTPGREKFHPKGRDNGYILDFDGYRVYLSGDTEGTPEMRALENIDLAFVCMNLPFTMDAKAAAEAVAEFKPTYVYPYHYRGRGEDGTQDPRLFAGLVGDKAEVRFGDWY